MPSYLRSPFAFKPVVTYHGHTLVWLMITGTTVVVHFHCLAEIQRLPPPTPLLFLVMSSLLDKYNFLPSSRKSYIFRK